MRQQFQQSFECDGMHRFAIARTRCYLLTFGNSYSIHKEEVILTKSIRRDVAQLVVADGANTTTLHLNIQRLGSHVAHEYQHFKRLYVCSRSHQRTSDCNTELLVVAELANQLVAVTCGIGYFLYELIICPAKHLFSYAHDIVGMNLIQGKDKGLRQIVHDGLTLWVGEHLRINGIAVCLQHQFDLSRIDDAAVQFLLGIVLGFLIAYRLNLARIACFASEFVTLEDGTAVFGRLGLDAIDASIHVHAIHDGLLQSVVYDDIVVEECFRLWYWRCRQADEVSGIEVFQHFLPVAIDGTVAFVNDNEIEEIRG